VVSPEGQVERVQLLDGSEAVIRPIAPEDKAAIVEGFEHLSPESRYRRFLSPMPRLQPGLLAYLTEVDHHDHEALVAFSRSGEPLGVARYVRTDEPDSAEAAVAVVDHWQGRGLGTALLQRLAGRARDEGIEWFTATLLAENREMRILLEELGQPEIQNVGGGVLEARVRLAVQTEPSAPLRRALRSAAEGQVEARPASPQ
jgi:GNAT superfamily N-acetyltransferase